MLDVIRDAREQTPLGLLMLDEQERGGRTVVIDKWGEQWEPCGAAACGICEEAGKAEGWRHALTGATVCTDCAGFTCEEFPLSAQESETLFSLAAAGDGEAASALLREAGERQYGEGAH